MGIDHAAEEKLRPRINDLESRNHGWSFQRWRCLGTQRLYPVADLRGKRRVYLLSGVENVRQLAHENLPRCCRREVFRLEDQFLPFHQVAAFVQPDATTAMKWVEKNIVVPDEKVARQRDAIYLQTCPPANEHVNQRERNRDAKPRANDERKQ